MMQSAKLSHTQKNNMNLREKKSFFHRKRIFATNLNLFHIYHISNHPTSAINIFSLELCMQGLEVICKRGRR